MAGNAPYLFNGDPALTNLSAGSFSIAFWLQVANASSVAPTTLVLAPAFKVTLNGDGTLTFLINDSAASVTTSVSSGAIVGGWNFVAILYDLSNKQLTIDLNGVTSQINFTDAADFSVSSYTPNFQLGATSNQDDGSASASFGLDEVSVWNRVLTTPELALLWNNGDGSSYPFFGGPFNLVFEGNLINTVAKPMVLGSQNGLWAVAQSYDSDTATFLAGLTPLYSGNVAEQGYNWRCENFSDKIIFAQRDNNAQYWTPPLPAVAQDVPGLPSAAAQFDGVTVFASHALFWRDDTLTWSDVDDFTTYIPVAQTAVSAVLTLSSSFIQPAPGGTVSVAVSNTVVLVKSVSLSGTLTFPNTNVGQTSTLLLNIVNSGTAVLNVSGISLPVGFSGSFSGQIPVGGSVPVLVTFAPTAAVVYQGSISVSSDATQGTTTIPVSGTGIGSTEVMELSGFLDFGSVLIGKPISSTLVITNSGNSTMTIAGITAPTDFTVGSFPSTIAAGATGLVIITFNPSEAVVRDGTIIVTGDSVAGTSSIAVQGTGINSFGSQSKLFITDNGTLQFGTEPTGSPVTGTLRIYNKAAGSTMDVVGITLPTGFTGSFTGSIAPSSHHDVTVTFTPTSAIDYSGTIFVTTVLFNESITVTGTGAFTGKVISLAGVLTFGETPVGGSIQALLEISNIGNTTLNVSSITYPTGFSGAFAGSVLPGATQQVIVTFSPTSAITFTGTVTVNSDASGTDTIAISGTGFTPASTEPLVPLQYVSLADVRGSVTYYNFYQVVSATSSTLVLQRVDLTGATPTGLTMPADGRQFFTLDANEAGTTRVVGAQMNGPIFRVVPQGDYAYSFKERSIQSIQYTGLGNGTFFIHNEIYGEGLISRDAFADRQDGTMVFLGHRELYAYQGGPNLTPVCQQFTRQLYAELDRSRLFDIRVFHNESRKEIWVVYPIVGGFRVLIWNYVEDSASLDDYDPSVQFTALGQVDWSSDIVWNQMAASTGWASLPDDQSWQSLETGSIDHATVLACADGEIRMHGLVYTRDGNPYNTLSESMDYDFGSPDIFKYVDVVVLGLDVKVLDNTPRLLYVQIGTQASLSGAAINWTAPQSVLVNGQQPVPVKVNPGGSGRYLRVRFSSTDANVQWRVSSFEIHCRPGGTY